MPSQTVPLDIVLDQRIPAYHLGALDRPPENSADLGQCILVLPSLDGQVEVELARGERLWPCGGDIPRTKGLAR